MHVSGSGGILVGSLIWSGDGLRSVEEVQVGDLLIGFDPAAFVRTTVTVERVHVQKVAPCVEVLVGGRLLLVHERQPLLRFDMGGNWCQQAASTLQPGDWLPVDRQLPSTSDPIALPDLDGKLTALLGEDALALLDSKYEQEKYFAEMGKRSLRIRLFELSGYLCGAGEIMGHDLTLADDEPDVLAYYRDAFHQTFGETVEVAGTLQSKRHLLPIVRRLRRWMGDGLRPAKMRGLPTWLWQVESQSRSAFLRGFFDACGTVSQTEVTLKSPSMRLITGIQAQLGMLGVESTIDLAKKRVAADTISSHYRLQIRNVRRFAEWVHSNVSHKAALLGMVYAKEPRYPSDGTAILPLNKVRPALERIRTTHALPRRSADTVDEREATRLSTLRLLSTAFDDEPLRALVNQQLYLEPITSVRSAKPGTLFTLSCSAPAHIVCNGVVVRSGLVG